jgi:hypothetical protein
VNAKSDDEDEVASGDHIDDDAIESRGTSRHNSKAVVAPPRGTRHSRRIESTSVNTADSSTPSGLTDALIAAMMMDQSNSKGGKVPDVASTGTKPSPSPEAGSVLAALPPRVEKEIQRIANVGAQSELLKHSSVVAPAASVSVKVEESSPEIAAVLSQPPPTSTTANSNVATYYPPPHAASRGAEESLLLQQQQQQYNNMMSYYGAMNNAAYAMGSATGMMLPQNLMMSNMNHMGNVSGGMADMYMHQAMGTMSGFHHQPHVHLQHKAAPTPLSHHSAAGGVNPWIVAQQMQEIERTTAMYTHEMPAPHRPRVPVARNSPPSPLTPSVDSPLTTSSIASSAFAIAEGAHDEVSSADTSEPNRKRQKTLVHSPISTLVAMSG